MPRANDPPVTSPRHTPAERQALLDDVNSSKRGELAQGEAQSPGLTADVILWLDGTGPEPDLSVLPFTTAGYLRMTCIRRRGYDAEGLP
jgi:hypothetical protein